MAVMTLEVLSGGNIGRGQKTVDTAGSAEAILAATGDVLWHSITILALTTNTGQVYVGGSGVSSTNNQGLDAGEAVTLTPHRGHEVNLSDIYLDVGTSTEGAEIWVAR